MRYPMILFLVVSLAMIASAAIADDDDKPLEKMDGLELYRAECRPCHLEDSENDHYTPMTLIGDQWDEFFDEYYLEAHADQKSVTEPDKPLTEVLTDDLLKKLRKFCVDHAADSEQPMTCG